MRLLPVTLLSLFLLPSRILCLPRKGANLISTLEILGDLRVKLADLVGNIPSHNFTENPDDQQRPLSAHDVMIHDLVSDSVFEEKRNEEIQKEKTDNNPFLQMKPVPSEIGTQAPDTAESIKDSNASRGPGQNSTSSGRMSSSNAEDKVCGCATNHRVLDASNSRIVGGMEAVPNALPWQVFIRIRRKFRCGGSILNKRFVVSAMHCFHGMVDLDHPGEDVLVGAGIHDLCIDTAITNHHWQVTFVHQIHHEGNYDPKSYMNDIAVLELDRDLKLNSNVQGICLPSQIYSTGTVAFVSGWGHMAEQETPCELQYLGVPILSMEVCRNSELGKTFKAVVQKDLPDSQMCAGHLEGGKDACQGDSGGPLATVAPNGNIELAGLVSWGVGCAKPNAPGAYTNVIKYIDFINRIKAPGECGFKSKSAASSRVTDTFVNAVNTSSPMNYSAPNAGDQSQNINSTNKDLANCLFIPWAGNGYCDDPVNTPECAFDLGDCCPDDVSKNNHEWNEFCKECQCKEEKKDQENIP